MEKKKLRFAQSIFANKIIGNYITGKKRTQKPFNEHSLSVCVRECFFRVIKPKLFRYSVLIGSSIPFTSKNTFPIYWSFHFHNQTIKCISATMFSEKRNSAKKWGDCLCVCGIQFWCFPVCTSLWWFVSPTKHFKHRYSFVSKKGGQRKHHIRCAHIFTEIIKIEIIV